MICRRLCIFTLIAIIANACMAHAEVIPGLPYERMEVTDSHGEKVVIYVTHPNKPAPLALLIQRAGCTPLFEMHEDGKYSGEIGEYMSRAAEDRLTLLAVEKNYTIPRSQVPYGKENMSEGCPHEFIEQDTFDFRLDNLLTALNAAKSLPWVLPGPILAVGVGDGAVLATAIARKDQSITNVAQFTATGVPGGWYFIEQSLRNYSLNIHDKEILISTKENILRNIADDSNSIDKYEFGLSYRYLSSYLKHSPLEDALNSNAKIYLLYSYENSTYDLSSMEMMAALLIAKERAVTTRRVAGYGTDPNERREHITEEYKRIVDWFVSSNLIK